MRETWQVYRHAGDLLGNLPILHLHEILACEIDYKLCKSAGNQLNALTRLKSFLGLKERAVLVNSFIYSNFDYCPLVWMFSHKKSLNKIESLHKQGLRFLLNG